MQRISFCQKNRKTSPPRQKVHLLDPITWKNCKRNSLQQIWSSNPVRQNHDILCVSVSTKDILMTRINTFQAAHNNAYKWFFQVSLAGYCLWLTNWIKLVQSILREEYANCACFCLWDSKTNWVKGRGIIGCWLSPSLGCFSSMIFLTPCHLYFFLSIILSVEAQALAFFPQCWTSRL